MNLIYILFYLSKIDEWYWIAALRAAGFQSLYIYVRLLVEHQVNMEVVKPKNIVRFSSCRAVAFELNPYKENPFSIPVPSLHRRSKMENWFGFHGLEPLIRLGVLVVQASSHFCDLEFDDLEIDEQ